MLTNNGNFSKENSLLCKMDFWKKNWSLLLVLICPDQSTHSSPRMKQRRLKLWFSKKCLPSQNMFVIPEMVYSQVGLWLWTFFCFSCFFQDLPSCAELLVSYSWQIGYQQWTVSKGFQDMYVYIYIIIAKVVQTSGTRNEKRTIYNELNMLPTDLRLQNTTTNTKPNIQE